MKYRHHRGGYAESMATVRDIHTADELREAIAEAGFAGRNPITIEYYGEDDRDEAWRTTYLVCVDSFPIGFTNDVVPGFHKVLYEYPDFITA